MSERIVSLLASGTEIVDSLSLGHRLVGISHECDFPPPLLDRPRVSRPRFDPAGLDSGGIDRAVRAAMSDHGSVYEVDAALLSRLRPGLVLTQAVCEVCAVPTPGVRELVEREGLDAEVLSLDAHTLDGILDTIRDVAAAVGEPGRGAEVAGSLADRLENVRAKVADAPRQRVLAVEWLDPPFTPGHWVPEMIEVAGGVCLAGKAGSRSDETTWEALAAHDPDVLLIMPCGYGLEDSIRDADAHADRLRSVGGRAVDAGRAYVVDGSSYFNRSGPRVVDGVEILAGLLHPERFAVPDPGAATVWRAP